ncbi:MAG: transglutaminase N-terminal domain-containing protein [Solirubrobacteraceae bacterium]
MKYKLNHQTLYTYVNEVHNYQSILCLTPINSTNQICNNFKLEITPTPNKIYSRKDYFGNIRHYFSLYQPHKYLKVNVSSQVEVLNKAIQSISFITCEEARTKFKTDRPLKIEILQYQLPSQFICWDNEIITFAR